MLSPCAAPSAFSSKSKTDSAPSAQLGQPFLGLGSESSLVAGLRHRPQLMHDLRSPVNHMVLQEGASGLLRLQSWTAGGRHLRVKVLPNTKMPWSKAMTVRHCPM